MYDYIIASDESAGPAEHDTDDEVDEPEEEDRAFFPFIHMFEYRTLS